MPSYYDYQDDIQSRKAKRELEEVPVEDFVNKDYLAVAPNQTPLIAAAPVTPVIPELPTDIVVQEPTPTSPYTPKKAVPVDDSNIKEVGSDPFDKVMSSVKDERVREAISKKIAASMNPASKESKEIDKAVSTGEDKEDKALIAAQRQAEQNRTWAKVYDSIHKFSNLLSRQKHVSTLGQDLEEADRPIADLKERRAAQAKREESAMQKEAQELRRQEAVLRNKGFEMQAQEFALKAKEMEQKLAVETMKNDPNSAVNKNFRSMVGVTPFGKELQSSNPETFNSLTVNSEKLFGDLSTSKDNNDTRKQIASDNAAMRREVAGQTAAIKVAAAEAKAQDTIDKVTIPGLEFANADKPPKLRDVDVTKLRDATIAKAEMSRLIEKMREAQNYTPINPWGEVVTNIESIGSDMLLTIKELRRTGVLDEQTERVLSKQIPGAKTKRANANIMLNNMRDSTNFKYKVHVQTYGYKIPETSSSASSPTSQSTPQQPQAQSSGMRQMVSPDGKIFEIPEKDVQAAIKDGGKLVK